MKSSREYGFTLPITRLEEVAAQAPERIYAEYPDTDWVKNGLHKITFKQVAETVDKVSYWLDENLGPSKSFDTFAYLGANDLRYVFLILAASKTGRQVEPRIHFVYTTITLTDRSRS